MQWKIAALLAILTAVSAASAAHCRVYDPRRMSEATQAIKKNPKDAEAYFNRAWFRGPDIRATDLALADVNKALELNPHVGKYYFLKASLLDAQEEDSLSLENINKALSISPREAEYLCLKSEILCHSRKPNEALEVADAAIKVAPNLYLSHRAKARALMQMAKWKGALPELDAEVRLRPEEVPGKHARLKVLIKLQRWNDAITSANQYLKALPSNEGRCLMLTLRAGAYASSGQYDKAITDYHSVLKIGDSTEARTAHLALAQLYQHTGKTEMAEKEREELRKLESDFSPNK